MELAEFVDAFGAYADRHNATVLVGAGLSRGADYPSWECLLADVRVNLGVPDMDDLAKVAQYYIDSDEGSKRGLQTLVRERLKKDPVPEPREIHGLLTKLPLPAFWTTNYDSLIERAIGATADVYWADDHLAETRERTGPRVYKMHGSLDDPGSDLLLTRGDFEGYPTTHPRFWSLLQASFLTSSFLFLGFSFTDPNFEQIFRMARLLHSEIPREHFAVLRRSKDPKDQRPFDLQVNDLENVGIHVLEILEYSELEPIMRALVARCRPRQLFMSGSSSEPSAETEDGAYPTVDPGIELMNFARQFGESLAVTSVPLVSAGEVGAAAGYALMEELDRRDEYEPERFTLVRRQQLGPLASPNLRMGTILFSGDEATDLRSRALSEVRALLAVGGGDGVAAEIAVARDVKIGVVPIARFAGAGQALWQEMSVDLEAHNLGGKRIDRDDFDALNSQDDAELVEAAIRLVQQALHLR